MKPRNWERWIQSVCGTLKEEIMEILVKVAEFHND